MNLKQERLVKSLLGSDVFDDLAKFEIYKRNTNTVIEPAEIKMGLQLVPRAVLSYLVFHLKPMGNGSYKTLDLPFVNAKMDISKHSNDNYSGEIYADGKKLVVFNYRTLPGIGLEIMSAFELYDEEHSNQPTPIIQEPSIDSKIDEKIAKLQTMIEDRIRLHSLISEVVEHKISEREAIQRIISDKIKQQTIDIFSKFQMVKEVVQETEKEETPIDQPIELSEDPMADTVGMAMSEENKSGKLKRFLEARKLAKEQKAQKSAEKSLDLTKSEINCPDCGTGLYKSGDRDLTLCICYGEHMNKKVRILKKENTELSLKFPKNFEVENIEMLSDALKSKKLKRIYE